MPVILRLVLIGVLLLSGTAHADTDGLRFDAPNVGTLRSGRPGELLLPQGHGPFPAVIILHGCNGITPHLRAWARRLAEWGYAAFILDSFGPRGITNICNHPTALPARIRAQDALAAADYLRRLDAIDSDRLAVLGFSHGADSALFLSFKGFHAPPFIRAVAAFYPWCMRGTPELAVDTQILIGSADDWTPADRCAAMLSRYASDTPHRPILKIYPGATHAFDVRMPPHTYYGHPIAYDAAAAQDAIARTRQFLDAHLRGGM